MCPVLQILTSKENYLYDKIMWFLFLLKTIIFSMSVALFFFPLGYPDYLYSFNLVGSFLLFFQLRAALKFTLHKKTLALSVT